MLYIKLDGDNSSSIKVQLAQARNSAAQLLNDIGLKLEANIVQDNAPIMFSDGYLQPYSKGLLHVISSIEYAVNYCTDLFVKEHLLVAKDAVEELDEIYTEYLESM